MSESATDRGSLRNVVLVGPGGSGKTTLAERLLLESGVITRAGSVKDGTTVCDHDPAEQRHGRSIGLSLARLTHAGCTINLLDAPGYRDFVAEVRAGLRAADCAVFVVAADEGIDPSTEALWRECEAVSMPRVVVVSKLDHARADLDGVVAQAVDRFGDHVRQAYMPTYACGQVSGLQGLLSPDSSPDDRAALIEGVIEESEDESLMDTYLAGDEVGEGVLVADLERAVARGHFFPVVPVCSTTGVGVAELLDLVVRAFPSPGEHAVPHVYTPAGADAGEVSYDPDAPLVAEVVRTTTDPYVGRMSIVRVFSGTLRADQQVHVSGHRGSFFGDSHTDHDEDERVGALACVHGATHTAVEQASVGEIVAVARLSKAETGDTLSSPDQPLVMRPWQMPDPLLPVAIRPRTRSDEDKLGTALHRLAAEDPTLEVANDPETHQLVLWCMGEAHAEVVVERLADRYSVQVDREPVRVPLRETFRAAGSGHGRHVKQSGGHGQFAVCDIEVEPLPAGSGFEFVDMVVGGAVPRAFIPSVEKGVLAQMEEGLRSGHPVVDIRVTLVDGKAHSVDSSDMAFQTAGGLALREAASAAGVTLLEPFDLIEVTVPDDLVGPVMSDLSSRRGLLLGNDPLGDGRTTVKARAPRAELLRYQIDLVAQTHGAGTFTRTPDGFEPAPEDVAARLT